MTLERTEQTRENHKVAGQKLKEMRLETGSSLRGLARTCLQDPSYLSKIERGLIPASPYLIDVYLGLSGLPEEATEVSRYELRLLYGKAPLPDLTNAEAEFLVTSLAAYRKLKAVS